MLVDYGAISSLWDFKSYPLKANLKEIKTSKESKVCIHFLIISLQSFSSRKLTRYKIQKRRGMGYWAVFINFLLVGS